MKPFVFTRLAQQDLGEIWNFIALETIEAADRTIESLEKAAFRLAKNPGIGQLREELAANQYRFFLVYPFLIVYRYQSNPLQIIRVLHGARNASNVLGKDFVEPL